MTCNGDGSLAQLQWICNINNDIHKKNTLNLPPRKKRQRDIIQNSIPLQRRNLVKNPWTHLLKIVAPQEETKNMLKKNGEFQSMHRTCSVGACSPGACFHAFPWCPSQKATRLFPQLRGGGSICTQFGQFGHFHLDRLQNHCWTFLLIYPSVFGDVIFLLTALETHPLPAQRCVSFRLFPRLIGYDSLANPGGGEIATGNLRTLWTKYEKKNSKKKAHTFLERTQKIS